MGETLKFKVFCLEYYRLEHGLSGSEAVRLFGEYGVFNYLASFYDVLHGMGANYLVQDIDQFIEARR